MKRSSFELSPFCFSFIHRLLLKFQRDPQPPLPSFVLTKKVSQLTNYSLDNHNILPNFLQENLHQWLNINKYVAHCMSVVNLIKVSCRPTWTSERSEVHHKWLLKLPGSPPTLYILRKIKYLENFISFILSINDKLNNKSIYYFLRSFICCITFYQLNHL